MLNFIEWWTMKSELPSHYRFPSPLYSLYRDKHHYQFLVSQNSVYKKCAYLPPLFFLIQIEPYYIFYTLFFSFNCFTILKSFTDCIICLRVDVLWFIWMVPGDGHLGCYQFFFFSLTNIAVYMPLPTFVVEYL